MENADIAQYIVNMAIRAFTNPVRRRMISFPYSYDKSQTSHCLNSL